MERPFVELIDGLDFFRAHALGVVLDDVLAQHNLETWLKARAEAGWPNDGGGRRGAYTSQS